MYEPDKHAEMVLLFEVEGISGGAFGATPLRVLTLVRATDRPTTTFYMPRVDHRGETNVREYIERLRSLADNMEKVLDRWDSEDAPA